MIRDFHRLRRRLHRLSKSDPNDPKHQQLFQALRDQINTSVDLYQDRVALVPKIELDHDLPISNKAKEIVAAINQHSVVVVCGATGSGKSTQLPLIALQAGLGRRGMIGHTQPRRIAARSIASRISQQLKTNLGDQVGFKIRFSDQTGEKTIVKLMTDGILLAETQTDPFLNQYELLIIDEAHERSLNIDFLLGYLKRLLGRRHDLRLIITSATIDSQRFADHFSTPDQPVPIIDVEGRSYPVDIQYRPVSTCPEDQSEVDLDEHLVDVVKSITLKDSGDLLVFLPTEHDIRVVSKKLKGAYSNNGAPDILPLYARLSTSQQNQIFAPGKRQRIVLATNVAESSLTVPRIRYVIDTGTARISHYAPRSKVQRLPIQAISQASCNQRAGRCGRIAAGVCVRLFSEEDFNSRPAFTTPEIRRTNLAAVILQTLALKLGNIDEFPFLDPPHPEAIRDGYKTLFELGAVDAARKLTPLGKKLAGLPVDPRIGRIMIAADHENCLAEVLIIAAGLEIQDPRQRPAEKQAAADQAHQKFSHPDSDFLTLLNLWDFIHQLKSDLSRTKLRRVCEQNFLSWNGIIQWQEIHRQLSSMVADMGLKVRRRSNDYDAIHRSLLAGLLSGIACIEERNEFLGAGGLKFFIWPGSGLFRSKAQWIVANEVVETSKRYARMVAKIDPDWIEPLAGHLVKIRHSDPHWSRKRQAVAAAEHVSLWGLPIVNGRKVNFGPIDPAASRDLFISEALTREGLVGKFDFLDHNQKLVDQINQEMAKTRRRDLIVDHYTIEAFYQQRVPPDIFDKVSLSQRLKKDSSLTESLKMQRSDLLPQADTPDYRLYPDQVQIGTMQVPTKYKFAPGESDDGATVTIPLAGLGQIDDIQAAWLVPGLIEPRVLALIRSLPKDLRRNLVPAPDTASRVAREIEFGRGSFYAAVANQLSAIGGPRITPNDFDLDKMEDHLKINLQIVDQTGDVVAQGRSMASIRQQLSPVMELSATNLLETDDSHWHQDGLTGWSWGDLPRIVPVVRGGISMDAFPAIIDQQTGVGLRLADSRAAADRLTRLGLVRLCRMAHRKAINSQVQWLPELDRHLIILSRFASSEKLRHGIGDLITRLAFVERTKIPHTLQAFEELNQQPAQRIGVATQEVARWLPKFATNLHSVLLGLESIGPKFADVKLDLQQQLDRLMVDSFLELTPWTWLSQYPRFLQAMDYRREKLSDLNKDRRQREELAQFWARYESTRESHAAQSIVDPELELFRWMIEEYRVSLFAQQLGTSLTVSAARLEKQWKKVTT